MWRLSCRSYGRAEVCYSRLWCALVGPISLLLVGEGSEGAENTVKQSLAYVQLERQNERLKEALVRYVHRSCCIPAILTSFG